MAKSVNVYLKLKDQFTKPLKVAKKGTKEFDKQLKYANKSIKSFANNLNNDFKKATIASAAALAGISAAAIKTGFSEALNLEGYRSQLETATKDAQKAAEIMQYAINLANKTPFEGGDLVEAAAKFEAMGMSAKKWLTYAGDMAGATNKTFDQATEALIDAQTGELERLKEFGITKAMIQKKADEMFVGQQVVNNKGQITNQEKFNEAMLALMEDKFAGGMEKQSSTLKGIWSTVTGITKSAMASVVGMTSSGSVKSGSALDIIKNKAKSVADTLVKWQNDGTLDSLADKAGNILSGALNKGSAALKFLKDNANWLLPVLKSVVAGFIAFNIVNGIAKTIESFTVIINVLKVAFAGLNVTTFAWQVAIVAIVAVILLLIANWKKVISWLGRLKEKFMESDGYLGRVRDNIFKVVGAFKAVCSWIGNTIGKLKDFFSTNSEKTVSINTQSNIDKGRPSTGKGPRHALGTTYFAGGRTRFSEGGRSEEAVFPSGTRIIPADKAGKSKGNKIVNVYVTVQGNVIGNEEYMEETGEYIANKIIPALDNI
ncbi:MAG: hypothetical protein ACI4WY_07415 [Anaerovoracaceae bacterium]